MVDVIEKKRRGAPPLSAEEKARRAALTPEQRAAEKQARKDAREAKVRATTAGKQPAARKPRLSKKAEGGAPKRQTVKESDPKTSVEDLTDDQHHSLFLQGVGKYQRALKAKKDADADLRNVGKLVKADLGSGALNEIKLYLRLQTDEGKSHLRSLAEVQMRLARWSGMPVGHTDDLFGEDRTPIEDMAFALGKRDGLAGSAAEPSLSYSGPLIQRYMQGYEEGRGVNLAGIKQAPQGFGSPPPAAAVDWEREGVKAFEAGSSDTPPGDVPADSQDDWRKGYAWAKDRAAQKAADATKGTDYWRVQGAAARRAGEGGTIPDGMPEEYRQAWGAGWSDAADEFDVAYWRKKGMAAWGQGSNGDIPADVPPQHHTHWKLGWSNAKKEHEGRTSPGGELPEIGDRETPAEAAE